MPQEVDIKYYISKQFQEMTDNPEKFTPEQRFKISQLAKEHGVGSNRSTFGENVIKNTILQPVLGAIHGMTTIDPGQHADNTYSQILRNIEMGSSGTY